MSSWTKEEDKIPLFKKEDIDKCFKHITIKIVENGWIIISDGKQYIFLDLDILVNKIRELLLKK